MYNINSTTTYSEDRRSLYLAVGFASLSLISYSETSSAIIDHIEPEVTIQIDQTSEEQTSSELTQHAMNLAQSSLAEDWNDESDEHWESFL
ncbi:hypothetical protein SAMN05428642_1155 [Flaviramulus basaltis]|uniref:Uncharacterized protein n=1 Tax=Flaviramulus basaltis TaxID=369401 RepID=A0A1K2IS04_9FLAO|nr:hypothetical protein [Flaviramulus basaltis]SFZ95209.1 hypothetical protein SAMN05428642_1155 [Flaviramulus basaltis]